MTSATLFAKLCIIEGNAHMIKARYLENNTEAAKIHIMAIMTEITSIANELISGDGTKLYFPSKEITDDIK